MRLGCDQGLRYRCPGMSPGLVLVGTECHGMSGDTQLGKRLHPHGKFTPQPSGTWGTLPEVQVAPLPRRAVPPQAPCSTSPRLVSLHTSPGGFHAAGGVLREPARAVPVAPVQTSLFLPPLHLLWTSAALSALIKSQNRASLPLPLPPGSWRWAG